MKCAKRNYAKKNRQWLKRHPWLKRRIPSLLPGILDNIAKHNPALRHFLDFDVEKLDLFKGLATKPHRAHTDGNIIRFNPAWLK